MLWYTVTYNYGLSYCCILCHFHLQVMCTTSFLGIIVSKLQFFNARNAFSRTSVFLSSIFQTYPNFEPSFPLMFLSPMQSFCIVKLSESLCITTAERTPLMCCLFWFKCCRFKG